MYALVINGIIQETRGQLPPAARRLDNGAWVMFTPTTPTADVEATGWFPIQRADVPELQPDERADYAFVVVGGRPVQQWTVRPETADELQGRMRNENSQTLTAVPAALAHLNALDAFIDWFNQPAIQTLANGTGNLSAAQMSDGLRRLFFQVERLTKGQKRVIRLMIGNDALDDISDT
jgi:hypothetical protein